MIGREDVNQSLEDFYSELKRISGQAEAFQQSYRPSRGTYNAYYASTRHHYRAYAGR
jgi:hypothetical protein